MFFSNFKGLGPLAYVLARRAPGSGYCAALQYGGPARLFGTSTVPNRTSMETAEEKPASKLIAACVLERLPVVVADMPDWEIEYKAWQWERAKRYLKPLPPELSQPDTSRQAGAETEMEWEPAPEVTDADRNNDTRSLNRALTKRLFLLLKGKGEDGWQFPSLEHEDGETLRETAERALHACVAPKRRDLWQTWTVSNAPVGHLEAEDMSHTLFFFRIQLIRGEPLPMAGSSFSDYAWLTKDELTEALPDVATQRLLQVMLTA